MMLKAGVNDRARFSVLWAEFLRDSHKAGSDVLPTPRNLAASLRIFDLYVSGSLQGAAYIVDGIGVTMVGEAAPKQIFESDYGRIAMGWGTYVRESHRGEGWSRKLREKTFEWAKRHDFDSVTGPIAITNTASLESCKKLGIETPSVVAMKRVTGV